MLKNLQQKKQKAEAFFAFKKAAKNEKTYQAAVKKFTEGSILAFEKVAFVDNVKAQYQTAPMREVINFAVTSRGAGVLNPAQITY